MSSDTAVDALAAALLGSLAGAGEESATADQPLTCEVGGSTFGIRVLATPGAERARCEKALLTAGVPLPLTHRTAWTDMALAQGSWFFAAFGPHEELRDGLAVSVFRSRALPGHLLLRVERIGAGPDRAARFALVRAIATVAQRIPRVIRVSLELFSRDPEERARVGDWAQECGFRRVARGRSYSETLVVDLRGTEQEVLGSLHGTARRHIRAVQRHPVEIRAVQDLAYVQRLEALLHETLERTGGRTERHDWSVILRFCNQHPDLGRLVGLFRTDQPAPDNLLAYALGLCHGDHVEYATAASTRHTDLKLPLAYGVAWDLMRWAKARGATWFDFGGITRGTHDDPSDPLGGISDFKRYFSRDVTAVGEEWTLEPRPVRAMVARLASRLAGRLRPRR